MAYVVAVDKNFNEMLEEEVEDNKGDKIWVQKGENTCDAAYEQS